eukprot:scaffold12512_cov79-Skeletonema_marinoi.AAC.3
MGHYKLWIVILEALDTIWCRVVLAAIPDWASSGHLRRCSDADTTNKYFSQAVDCHFHSVRYDMVLESSAGSLPNSKLGLFRSPTTLKR